MVAISLLSFYYFLDIVNIIIIIIGITKNFRK